MSEMFSNGKKKQTNKQKPFFVLMVLLGNYRAATKFVILCLSSWIARENPCFVPTNKVWIMFIMFRSRDLYCLVTPSSHLSMYAVFICFVFRYVNSYSAIPIRVSVVIVNYCSDFWLFVLPVTEIGHPCFAKSLINSTEWPSFEPTSV